MSRSGRFCCASSSASCPFDAVSTRNPALRSFSDTTFRMCDSSSATRMVFSFSAITAPFASSAHRALPTASAQIQLKPETAPLPNPALNEQPSAVHGLDDVLHQREAEPGAVGHPLV